MELVNPSLKLMIRKMGLYLATFSSAVQFNSLAFRLIAGVLAGIKPEVVALVTSIEFLLNAALEVPFGRIADKFGRVPSAIVGLTLTMSGLVCVYTGLQLNQESLSELLFIIHGILIGIAKPLMSGSIEAFYQDALFSQASTPNEKQEIQKSMTTCQENGKYYTTLSVISAFILSAIFYLFGNISHVFLIGAALYLICIVMLIKDYKTFGDKKTDSKPIAFNKLIGNYLKNRLALKVTLLNLSYWMMTVVIAGYFLISLGREFQGVGEIYRWAFMISFTLGYASIGWVLKGYLLPKLINKLSPKKYLMTFYFVIFASSLLVIALHQKVSLVAEVVFIAIYGAIFHLSASVIQSISLNKIMSIFERSNYASVISLQNIPGFIWVGLYSSYLNYYSSGAPSVIEALSTVAVISFLFLIFSSMDIEVLNEA